MKISKRKIVNFLAGRFKELPKKYGSLDFLKNHISKLDDSVVLNLKYTDFSDGGSYKFPKVFLEGKYDGLVDFLDHYFPELYDDRIVRCDFQEFVGSRSKRVYFDLKGNRIHYKTGKIDKENYRKATIDYVVFGENFVNRNL